MDKFREAFEQIPEIAERIKRSKMEYNPEYDFFHAPEWDSQSCSDQDFVNNFRKGWQSRQSEFDAMTEALLKQTQLLAKKRAEINQLQSQINEMAEVGLSQESVIREKDKRISQALNFINNWWHPNVDQKLFIEDVSKALRGHDQYTEHRTKAEQQINKGARLTKHQIDL